MAAPGSFPRTFIVTALLLSLLLSVLSLLPREASAFTSHSPIYISGDLAFTSANGVTAGNGTAGNPYIIEGWDIVPSFNGGIQIRSTTAYFIIRNVYIHGALSYDGIYLYNLRNGRIENSTINGVYRAVDTYLATYTTVTNSNLTNSGYGVYAYFTNYFNITSSRILSSTYFGIYMYYATSSTIQNNTFSNDGVYIYGFGTNYYTSHTITTDNLINGKPLHFYKNCIGVNLDNVSAGEVIMANCSNVRLANLVLNNSDVGVEFAYVTNGTITRSSLLANTNYGLYTFYGSQVTVNNSSLSNNRNAGVYTYYTTNLVFRDNTMNGNTNYGIYTYFGSQLTITNNSISNNRNYGVYTYYTTTCALRNNIMTGNTYYGMYLTSCGNTVVRDNLVTGAFNYGIYIYFGTSGVVSGNNASSNWYGIYLSFTSSVTLSKNRLGNEYMGLRITGGSAIVLADNNATTNSYGFYITSATYVTAYNNTLFGNTVYGLYLSGSTGDAIYHNNFLSNGVQAYDSSGTQNVWNLTYPGGGNFWSNYTGTDNCNGPGEATCNGPDGFGEPPFFVDGNSIDYYPLLHQWGLPNTPPTASLIIYPLTGDTLTDFSFDASLSSDPQDPGWTLTVKWDWNYDGVNDGWDTGFSSSQVLVHRYTVPGTFTVRVQVRDPGGLTSNATRSVMVSLAALHTSFTSSRTSGVGPLAVSFTASGSGGATPYAYSWNFGDGSSTATIANPSHTFQSAGTYTVTLTISDAAGQTATSTMKITVLANPNQPPQSFSLGGLMWPLVAVVVATSGLIGFLVWRRKRVPKVMGVLVHGPQAALQGPEATPTDQTTPPPEAPPGAPPPMG